MKLPNAKPKLDVLMHLHREGHATLYTLTIDRKIFDNLLLTVTKQAKNEPDEITVAVNILQDALSNDRDFYETYKANLAMAFYDEFRNNHSAILDSRDIVELGNKAADRFLKQFASKSAEGF